MSWTIRCDDMTTVTAFPLPGCPGSLGYVTRESDKCAPCQQDLTPSTVTGDGASAYIACLGNWMLMQWPFERHALATHNI
jgi:hypothetical protein